MLRMERKAKLAKKPTPQCAFVYILPNFVHSGGVRALIEAKFAEQGIRVLREGDLDAKEIDDQKLVDMHYYTVASKATLFRPDELQVPKDKFEDKFGESWDLALQEGRILNAIDLCAKAHYSAEAIDAALHDAPNIDPQILASVGNISMPTLQSRVRNLMTREALARVNGNRSAAARLLGVTRQAVQQFARRGADRSS